MRNKIINNIICGNALKVMKDIPSNSISLVVTSPPYWNLVDYHVAGQIGQCTYEEYIADLLEIWCETERVLSPNGKLAIVTPIIPIEKKVIGNQHTRHLKNIAFDIEFSILHNETITGKKCSLLRYSLFVWQKQTTTKMFGSYPYPPNIYEDNTIEFINVYVKAGAPKIIDKKIKNFSKLEQKEWLNLTMQVWPIMPEDIKRAGGHPAPFPLEIPNRLIAMYTFKSAPKFNFEGDIVLDMFVGSGTTCLSAKTMGRRYIGIDINKDYCQLAKHRLDPIKEKKPFLLIDKVRIPKKIMKNELQEEIDFK